MTLVASPSLDAPAPPSESGSARRRLRRAITADVTASVAATYLLVLVVAAAAANVVAPADPERQDLAHVLAGPSARHWLGTDRLGRDVLSRLIFGARPTLLDVLIATTVFLVLALPLGVVAGYRGGWLDRVVLRGADLILAVPHIVVLLMVVAVSPGNDYAAMITLGVLGCPGLLRIVRGATLAVREELYVKAARLSGLGTAPILRRHILPRISGPIIVQTSLFAALALLTESGLSFLGLARPEPAGPSWGNMVGEASAVLSRSAWLLVPTGGAIAITVMALVVVGDAVRDATVERSAPPQALFGRRRPAPAIYSPAVDSDPAGVLSVRGLTVTLPAGREPVIVVRDVDFDIAAGETVGLVGESGCGKTITAKAILGLLPAGGHIAAGSVRLGETELATLSERALRGIRGSGIALISQDPVGSLDPTFTVGSQLREVIRHHQHKTRGQATDEAVRLLRLVNLPDPHEVLRRRPPELSGGMAQRVCIALALASRPRLLIADEPTTALDMTVQAEILTLLRGLQDELGMAVLLITHDWGVVADLCDRALVMYAGEVVEAAPVDELYSAPRHPYTRALLAANPHRLATGDSLPAIPGAVPKPGAWPAGCHFQPRCALATAECAAAPVELAPLSPERWSRCIHVERVGQ